MSLLVAAVLFAIGLYLVGDYGSSFFGFLFIVGGVLALFLNGKRKEQAYAPNAGQAAPYQTPIIIRSGGHSNPYQQIKLRIHEPWDSARYYEDTFNIMGRLFLWPIKILWRIIRVMKGKG